MTPPMGAQGRIAVFTGSLTHSVRKGIVVIDRAIPGLSWLVLLHAPRRNLRQLLRNQWRNLRRNGWRWVPYQLADLIARLAPDKAICAADAAPGCEYTRAAIEARPNVRLLEVADIHADDALQATRSFAPDLGLSLAAPMLRRSLFAVPRLGTVNLHKGKVPDYRGMPPAFWELWNDAHSVGCTVHWVDDKLDTGDIAATAVVEREKFSTLRGLQLRLDEVGVELMRDVVRDVLNGHRPAVPQAGGGRTYRKPTLAQAAALDTRLARTEPRSLALPKRMLKAVVHRGAALASTAGLLAPMTPRITVLLYHRVTDEVRDNLTVGIAQFDRQMALLRARCRVLSLAEVIATDVVPKTREPLVCVTFDDGYLDNYRNAAPVLQRHRVPAAFFVSTGIVASDRRFPHDVRRENPPIAVMNWEQLREMHAAGFTIGSHTVSHIDCAAEPEDVVRRELAQSRDDLRRELGLVDVLFAYPYGGRQHMTPARLELVKQAGFAGCLSAYGGTNIGRVDRYNVVRRGIHWEYSDRAFLFEGLGFE